MKYFILCLSAMFLFSCASSQGFNRDQMRSVLNDDSPKTESEIEQILSLKPQLPRNFKLAVYFKGNSGYYGYGYSKWTSENKEKLQVLKQGLIDKGIISDAFIINDSIVSGPKLKDIRIAAARSGADAVMVIDGVSSVDRYNNPLGATYCLLVTPFFVPGTEADALFVSRANLWDVRNEYLYLSVESEGMANETRPAFFSENEGVIEKAKKESMNNLAPEVLDRIIKMELNSR